MRCVLGLFLAAFMNLASGCEPDAGCGCEDLMECACRGASMLNVWPEGEQVLPVSRPGWLGVRAVGLDGPEVMELAFVSEPPGAFELVLDEIVSAAGARWS